MPATRTNKPSTSQKGHSKQKQKGRHDQPEAIPGVQKLKSLLRQTRRLLAKDNIAADVRVETERRLKSLQADLEHAETANKERTVAVRYHKVKFFERQKVLRKIQQTKRQLEKSPDNSNLKSRLFELRVDLNYILEYPKAKKYISLFPPEARNNDPGRAVSDSAKAQTDLAREEVRTTMRELMKNGDLNGEPELHMLDDKPKAKKSGTGPSHKSSSQPDTTQDLPDIQDDGFFGSDDEEESD